MRVGKERVGRAEKKVDVFILVVRPPRRGGSDVAW